MLEEYCMRSCELDEAYDIEINPDDIDVTDNVTIVWGIKKYASLEIARYVLQ